jgi:hypothetical protein
MRKYTIDGARSVLKGSTNKGSLIKTETVNEKQKIIVKKIRENLETILSIISK